MGNLHSTREIPSRINPLDYPYLHIVPTSTKEGLTYAYLPTIGNPWVLAIHQGEFRKGKFFGPPPLARMEYELVPPLTQIPPPALGTQALLAEMESRHLPAVIEALNHFSQASAILSEHGSFWGFEPERRLARLLLAAGFNPRTIETFPLVEDLSRKRIQTHAILLQR